MDENNGFSSFAELLGNLKQSIEDKPEKVNTEEPKIAIEMSAGAEEAIAEEEVSEIIASLRAMLGSSAPEPAPASELVSERMMARETVAQQEEIQVEPQAATEIAIEEQKEVKPTVSYKELFADADLPTTVGLMVMLFFKTIFTIIFTILLDFFNLGKRFVSYVYNGIKGRIVDWAQTVSEDWSFFRQELREANGRQFRREVVLRYPHLFQNILNVVFPVIGLIILIGTITRFSASTYALEVKSGGQSLGFVENEAVYTSAESKVKERFSADLTGDDSTVELQPTYQVVTVKPNELTDADTISDSIVENAQEDATYACGVYIDGDFLCALKSELDARQVFNNILDGYEKSDEKDVVGFVEDVQFVQGLYEDNENTIWDSEKLTKKLTEQKAESKYYTAKEDDTISSIAYRNNISVKSLRALNPDLGETVKVGDQLLVAHEANYVRTKIVKTVVSNDSTSYKTIKNENSKMYKGTKKIKRKGSKGIDKVTRLVTYVDGVKVNSEEIDRVTIKAPVDEIVDIGTKKNKYGYSSSSYKRGGARLVWPAVGVHRISSRYGYRWGRLHGGIDISDGKTGHTVVAAASGTVTTASYHYSYGYHVVINNGNGMSTCYAHMLKGSICVKPGQYVSAGQPIGKVGSTGNSTGPHLHFEVRINGNRVNPAPYIGA